MVDSSCMHSSVYIKHTAVILACIIDLLWHILHILCSFICHVFLSIFSNFSNKKLNCIIVTENTLIKGIILKCRLSLHMKSDLCFVNNAVSLVIPVE